MSDVTGGTGQQIPPGWFPDSQGQLRWWDGTKWGEVAGNAPPSMAFNQQVTQAPTDDPRNTAMLAHLLGLFVGIIGPLVIYLMNGEKDPFVRHHAAEALNFQITVLIGAFVSALLMLVLIGFLLLPIVFITALIFEIQGSMAAKRGEWWAYPINIRMISGSVAC